MAALLHSALALVTAVAAAASGAAVHVTPRSGTSTTAFAVGFTAPAAAGHQGVFDRRYEIGAEGPAHRGCTTGSSSSAAPGHAGERVRVTLRPGRDHWCRGSYTGSVTFTEGPYCRPGHVCPLFVTRVRTIGHFHFRVR